MVTNHRKKSSRGRGSWTHGHGEKKKHRGAGSRGGRGNAGSGKRGDAKKPSYWKIKKFVGKHGFTNPAANTVHTMSISQVNTNINTLLASGNAKKTGDVYAVDLKALGVDKLLGTGNPAYKYEISVVAATQGAQDKIASNGGCALDGCRCGQRSRFIGGN